MRTLRLALSLAFQDWLYERTQTFCAVLALVSMLTPILVLEGVRNGVVESMREKLLQDPSVLVLSPMGGSTESSFSKEEIASFGALQGAQFVIGRIREIATDISLRTENGPGVPVHMEPCAQGEPLLTHHGLPLPADGPTPGLLLSARAASKLGVAAGDTLTASLGRKTREGRLESYDLHLTVTGILPADLSDRTMGFLPLSLLEDIQDYRDDIAVPSRGMTGRERTAPRRYASFRLYAKDLDSVESLSRELFKKGIETRTRSHEIAAIRALNTSVNRIILILSLAVAAGFVAFTVSSAQGMVKRKLRMLGLMRLFGFSRLSLSIYPMTQSLLTSVVGIAFSLIAYLVIGLCIDSFFAVQSGGSALCRLATSDFFAAVAAVFLLSALAAGHAAGRSASVDPSAVMREV